MKTTNNSDLETLLLTISNKTLIAEKNAVIHLLDHSKLLQQHAHAITARAKTLIKTLRKQSNPYSIEHFLQQYGLDQKEGIAIMCLAEALLRIPDADTANALIHDKLKDTDWEPYLEDSESFLANASTYGLMLTGSIVELKDMTSGGIKSMLGHMIGQLGEPVIRSALKKAMAVISTQFVIGETIEDALKHAQPFQEKGYMFSYDMLGESARSEEQANQYYYAYFDAIQAAASAADDAPLMKRPNISVKLSALHPRYHLLQQDRVNQELLPKLKAIIQKAMEHNITISIDAEEATRLDLSLQIFQEVITDSSFEGFNGIGFVLQAYQKRAIYILDYLIALAKHSGKTIPIRLVKGAYWDTEIKHAQELGLEDYPVFTRKHHTDLSYLVCAKRILDHPTLFYAQFATHNAHTIASILELTDASDTAFEFQRLQGTAEGLYDHIVLDIPTRIYAPVGKHHDLLAYLIRRLLENTANTSFLHALANKKVPISQLVEDPIHKTLSSERYISEKTPLPKDIYTDRINSTGVDLGLYDSYHQCDAILQSFNDTTWQAAPIIDGNIMAGNTEHLYSPFDTSKIAGEVVYAKPEHVVQAIDIAQKGYIEWNRTSVEERAACLDNIANHIEEDRNELIALCIYEAGKTISDAIKEVREAADFCRYYAAKAREYFLQPLALDSPTGEYNQLSLEGRGIFACISPWNFPLAIFTGQITAALVSGNSVIAKPASQTPLIAYHMTQLMLNAGIPSNVLQLLPGDGRNIGSSIVSDSHIAGVCFTGSTDTARTINQLLAKHKGPIVPFIAETGGQNAMIVDSTALAEQAVDDIILSAFGSAGQRCSALRVLYVQEDIADTLIPILIGAMKEQYVGMSNQMATDIGPVIDDSSKHHLLKHIERMKRHGTLLHTSSLDTSLEKAGHFVAPHLFEINSLSLLKEEVFGPILHLIRYKANELDHVIEEINQTGYGLTFAIHSRIEEKTDAICARINAGNTYVNRSQIGAVVGVQPFGGQGLSGTGPKAGGPYYLLRFANEKTTSINTAAIGGNIELLAEWD